MKINYNTLNAAQKAAWKKICRIHGQMLTARTQDELFDLFCAADDTWWENFPLHAEQAGDE